MFNLFIYGFARKKQSKRVIWWVCICMFYIIIHSTCTDSFSSMFITQALTLYKCVDYPCQLLHPKYIPVRRMSESLSLMYRGMVGLVKIRLQ